MPAPIEKIESIFHQALTIPAADREAFVERACGGDTDLRGEVESLLRHGLDATKRLEAALVPVACELVDPRNREDDFFIGAMLGPYRLEEKLGEGGMGAVYLATDTRLERNVAIKVISRAPARTAEARARFRREARSAAALAHANIATLHDVDETSDTPWLVMEYVRGSSLRHRLSVTLPESVWLRYATELAAALEHAHARNIIHRDIKPENILVSEDDHIKVIDFGLARAIQGQANITGPNAFLGTLAYTAPELLSGASASARSDVYSLGVVLYEMASGSHPFAGLKGYPLISAILAGNYPECSTSIPGMPSVIRRCMAREPAERYKDAAELAVAIRHLDPPGGPAVLDRTRTSLAVCDFRNLGAGPELDWLGAGIAETLSADLARLKFLRVVSRSRLSQITNTEETSALEVGRELEARWIVSGAYQQTGSRIRVIPTLIDATTGDIVATNKVDGNWSDLFDIQDRVAAIVRKALAVEVGTVDRQQPVAGDKRDIAAYKHYARGRKRMYVMEPKSLSSAIHHFERAVGLDPGYALAYSGLGTSCALQFIRTSNPDDIIRASGYLERAIELDPELGEPYPWLANIRVRKNDPAGAAAAAQKGVELQPDIPESHYFYSGLHYMIPEFRRGSLRETPPHLLEALRLQPRFHPAWILLGASTLFLGKHADAARILDEAIRIETEPDLIYRFVGARTLLAFTDSRRGLWDSAYARHSVAFEELRETNHVYTSCFQALSACGLGDVELRRGNRSAAQAHYRHARRIIREAPRALGSARLLIRIHAGLVR